MSDTVPPPGPPEGASPDDEASRPSLEPMDSLPPPPVGRTVPRIFVVSGGKGGLGKTVLAANLGVYLASVGRRALLVDADPQGANAHTLVGVSGSVARRSHEPIDTPVPGLRLLHTGADEGLSGLRRAKSTRSLFDELLVFPGTDYVVVDLGTATTRAAIAAMLRGGTPILVTLPEPTALESTYRVISRAFLAHLVAQTARADRLVIAARARQLGGSPPPLDLWRSLEDDGHPLADDVRAAMEAFRPALVLAQTRLRADLDLGDSIRSTVRRRLGITLEYLGHVEYDDTVWSCVRSRKLLLVESPGTKAAKNIEKIARRLLAIESGKRRPAVRTVPPESHHDLLEVERGATEEEVRRAYKRSREVYAQGALACYGLFEPQEIEALRARLDEAHDVLLDPARRRPYELSVFPPSAEHDEPLPAHGEREEPLPPAPEITPDTAFTGAILKAVRESRGVRLEEISTRTKVGIPYLAAIEADDFAALPAPVYVRGFVGELAKYLGLDATQVARTYVRRLRRAIEERKAG
ncbi:MAG: helix-turn-helix domain-containing protein [Sandaracinus sp.]